MTTYTRIGHDIPGAEKTGELTETAKAIAIGCHVKWDGCGYPYGSKGEAIPIETRIVALADVFEALTSEQRCKRAWRIEQAAAGIQKQRDRHFGSRLVDLLIDIPPDLQTIRQQQP